MPKGFSVITVLRVVWVADLAGFDYPRHSAAAVVMVACVVGCLVDAVINFPTFDLQTKTK